MDEDELMKAVIDRFSPDELCEILDISTTDFVNKFYDEIIDDPRVREVLGIDEDDYQGH
jgi:hypothetical protein